MKLLCFLCTRLIGRQEFLEGSCKKTLMCAPGLYSTEAMVRGREIKNLPREIKTYTNYGNLSSLWKQYIFFIYHLISFFIEQDFLVLLFFRTGMSFLKRAGDSQQDSYLKTWPETSWFICVEITVINKVSGCHNSQSSRSKYKNLIPIFNDKILFPIFKYKKTGNSVEIAFN